jgi:transcription elongation GreA/GreB family factor
MLVIDIRGIDRQINDAHCCLNRAVIVDSPSDTERVTIGVTVTILRDGEESMWSIVGFGESDSDQKMIAYNTPLASLLIGKHEGDIIKGTITGKHTEIEIMKISIGGKNADT